MAAGLAEPAAGRIPKVRRHLGSAASPAPARAKPVAAAGRPAETVPLAVAAAAEIARPPALPRQDTRPKTMPGARSSGPSLSLNPAAVYRYILTAGYR